MSSAPTDFEGNPPEPNPYKVAAVGGADGEPEGVTDVHVGDRFVYTGNRPDFVLLADDDDEVECPPGTELELVNSYAVYFRERANPRGARLPLAKPYMNYELSGVHTTFKCTVHARILRRIINSEQLWKK